MEIRTKLRRPKDGRFAVAFYGIEASQGPMEAFYRNTIGWFAQINRVPDKMGVTGAGFSGKLGDYKRTAQRINRNGFSGVEALDIKVGIPGGLMAGIDYYASATISSKGDGYAAIVIPTSDMAVPSWLVAVGKIADALKPAYGIGYFRELRFGPALYAVGVGFGEDLDLDEAADEAARNRSHWCLTAMPMQLYRKGIIRDVYPWNFLTSPQLDAKISGTSWRRWIEADSTHGSLKPFLDDVYLWTVGQSEIPQLRKELTPIIFNWRNFAED